MTISATQATGSAARSASTPIPPPRAVSGVLGRCSPGPLWPVTVSAVDMRRLLLTRFLLAQHGGRVGRVVVDRRADRVLGHLVPGQLGADPAVGQDQDAVADRGQLL